jgi:hypothetical protein
MESKGKVNEKERGFSSARSGISLTEARTEAGLEAELDAVVEAEFPGSWQ